MKKQVYKYHQGLECLQCGDKIYSLHRHDYRSCKCGKCFVDGGISYFRYGFDKKENVKIIKIRIYPIKNTKNWSFKPNQVAKKKTKRELQDEMYANIIAMVDYIDRHSVDKQKK